MSHRIYKSIGMFLRPIKVVIFGKHILGEVCDGEPFDKCQRCSGLGGQTKVT